MSSHKRFKSSSSSSDTESKLTSSDKKSQTASPSSSSSSHSSDALIPMYVVTRDDMEHYDESVARKLAKLLDEVKHAKGEKDHSDDTLKEIMTTNERMQTEQTGKKQVTQYLKTKLKGLNSNAKRDAMKEASLYRKALARITEIRVLRSEKLLSSGSEKVGKSKPTVRRGVLMSVLSQYALTVPLYCGRPGERPPPLCGAIPATSDHVCSYKDKVAAKVKGLEELEENWILAEVVSYEKNTNRYKIDDIDAEEGERTHILSKRRIIPLPKCRAHPHLNPQALFLPKSIVLALYPQTTCFYKAVVSSPPSDHLDNYLVLFEDNTYPEGYSPPLSIPQCYVVKGRVNKVKK